MTFKNFLFLVTIFFGVVYYFTSFTKSIENPPIPIEFVEKKNNRKIIKQGRKKWIDNMHKSNPDVDWKKIDKKNRKLNTDKVIQLRKELLANGRFEDISDNFEIMENH